MSLSAIDSDEERNRQADKARPAFRAKKEREALDWIAEFRLNNRIPPFACAEENKLMDRANPIANDYLKDFLAELPELYFDRAVEVACGNGHVTRDVLLERYREVYLFDRDPVACQIAKNI